jgi:hypothetical protein
MRKKRETRMRRRVASSTSRKGNRENTCLLAFLLDCFLVLEEMGPPLQVCLLTCLLARTTDHPCLLACLLTCVFARLLTRTRGHSCLLLCVLVSEDKDTNCDRGSHKYGYRHDFQKDQHRSNCCRNNIVTFDRDYRSHSYRHTLVFCLATPITFIDTIFVRSVRDRNSVGILLRFLRFLWGSCCFRLPSGSLLPPSVRSSVFMFLVLSSSAFPPPLPSPHPHKLSPTQR